MRSELFSRGAVCFFGVVFLNACVDLGHKIVVQNTIFKLYQGDERVFLTAVANALILLPYIFFFAASGTFSDRHLKAHVMRYTAWWGLACTLLATAFYALGWFWLAFAMVFLLGVQSAFFGPAKLAYVRIMFAEKNIIAANGIAQAVVILAIFFSSLGFSLGFEKLYSQLEGFVAEGQILQQMLPLAIMLVGIAILQLLVVYRIPENNTHDAPLNDGSPLAERSAFLGLSSIRAEPLLKAVVIGLTMFWSSGQVVLAVFPEYYASRTGETNTAVIQGVMASMAIGVGLGSILAGLAARRLGAIMLIKIGALGLSFSLLLLQLVDSQWLALATFLLAGTMGGLFVVPLYSILQLSVHRDLLGRVLAANNFWQNIVMGIFLVATMLAATFSINAQAILAIIAFYAFICVLISVNLLNKNKQRLGFLAAKR